MASNAVLQDKQFRVSETVARAQLAINLARPSRPRLATSVDQSRIIDLELKAGVSVKFTPDRREELPDSFVLLVGKLKEMEALHADWDSYGGKPLSDAAVLPAIQLALIGIHRCEAPNLFLRPNGGIGLRWHNGNRELEIDVDPNGNCTAFLVTPDGEVEVDEPKDADDLAQFVLQVCRMD